MPTTPKKPLSLKARYDRLDDEQKKGLKGSLAYQHLCDKYLKDGKKRKPSVWLVLDTQDFLETRDAKRPRTKVEMDPEILAALDECPPTVRGIPATASPRKTKATAKKPPTRKPRTQRPKAPATQVEITAITVVAEPRPEPKQPVAEIPVTVAPIPAPAPAPVTPALKPAPEPTEPKTETAEYHLNEAKRHLVIALGILLSHVLTSAGRLAERVQAWAQPHVARLRLSIRTAWMVVPEPMRKVAEAMAPPVRAAISHLARAIILFAIEQVKALAPRVHAITTKWEAEALITLASTTEVITARFSK